MTGVSRELYLAGLVAHDWAATEACLRLDVVVIGLGHDAGSKATSTSSRTWRMPNCW